MNNKYFGTIIFIIIITGCASDSTRQATKEELALFYKAIETNDKEICYQFDPRAENQGKSLFDYDTGQFELRNHCFYTIAIQLHDPKLCGEMGYLGSEKVSEYTKPDGTEVITTLGGYEAYKEECIKKSTR